MMFVCGFIVASCIWTLIAIALLWRDTKKTKTQHERYVKEYQRAEYGWRHPRMMRHKRKYPAPLPLKWW